MADSSRLISRLAKPMKVTISATEACPFTCSTVPMITITITAMVEAPRVSTLTTAHQLSTGNWCAITWSAIWPKRRRSAASRVKDCTTITLASASCAVLARLDWKNSAFAWPSSVRWVTSTVTAQNSSTSAISTRESCQLSSSVSGSSTSSAT